MLQEHPRVPTLSTQTDAQLVYMQLPAVKEMQFITWQAILLRAAEVAFLSFQTQFLELTRTALLGLQGLQKEVFGRIPFSAYLFTRQRMETFSNFGERALSQFPPDQIVSDPFGVIKVLEDVGCGAT